MIKYVKRFIKKVCRRIGLVDVIEHVKVERYQVEQAQDVLSGKNILITGGSSGIGLAIAKKCIACGACVLITGRDERKLAKIKAEDTTGRLMSLVWDVTEFADLSTKLDTAIKTLGGRLDILINNAGVSIRQLFGELTFDVWDLVTATNLKAPVFISQIVANRWMKSAERGVILNISSLAGEDPAFDAYSAAKCALTSITRGVAASLAPSGIRVNAIVPGVVIGTNLRKLQRSIKPEDDVRCPWIPARRYCVPGEIAELAVFMVSDKTSYMNGAVVVIDGASSHRR